MTPVLQIHNLSKTFPGQVALDNASLTVLPGQVHALVGQNGSGKSTMIKVLAGYHRADPGARIEVLGQEVASHDLEAQNLPIHVMHQDLGLVDTMNAIENLALDRGFHTRGGRIRWREEAARARRLLAEFGADFDVRAPIAGLSAVERSVLALARSLQDWDGSSGLLILDEPTAALPKPEVDRLFTAIRRVADQGAGVVFVSHRLDEVFDIADHITVLRDGQVVSSGDAGELDHDQLVELIVGRPVDELYVPPPDTRDEVVLEVRNLWGDVVADLDLSIRVGEIVGIAGLLGSGRDELSRLVFGADRRARGSVTVDGASVPEDPQQAIALGVGYVPADRKGLASIPAHTVRENITLPRLGTLHQRGRLSRGQERREAREWVARVDLRPPEPEHVFGTLSGGNQQKAVLARWLRTKPRLLLLDEPTQGVDVGAKAGIYELLAAAAGGGCAVLVSSSEADELAHICDRVLVMRNGRVTAELSGPALTEAAIVQQSMAADSERASA